MLTASARLSCAPGASMRSVRPPGRPVLAQAARPSDRAAMRTKRGIIKVAMVMSVGVSRRAASLLATPARFERAALGLGILRSILLSYGVGAAELRQSRLLNKAIWGFGRGDRGWMGAA